MDAVVLESGLSSLKLSENERLSAKENANKKVEEWLKQSSPVTVAEETMLPRKQEAITRERLEQYRRKPHQRSVVKTAMI